MTETKRNRNEISRRYIIFAVALFFIALGVSLITRSLTGTSPISSVPYVWSLSTPLTMGSLIFILNVVLIILQMAMLGREGIRRCRTELWLQIPVSVLFGGYVDMTMAMLASWHPDSYWLQLATTLAGVCSMAFGVALEVLADVAMVSGEYFVHIASRRFSKPFGNIKLAFDVSLVVLAAICSLLLTGTIEGLREGTVITAVLTGPLVRLIMPRLRFVERWETRLRPVATR